MSIWELSGNVVDFWQSSLEPLDVCRFPAPGAEWKKLRKCLAVTSMMVNYNADLEVPDRLLRSFLPISIGYNLPTIPIAWK